tara:strand:+ start:673 stop:1101 length:429 start_codon:yes stop_codon:yes gene_type:complete
MIHLLLTPILLFSSILTEITLNENHRIKGIVVTANTQVNRDLMAVTPGDWILMKGLIESNDGECKAIINDGIAICKHQLDVCHDTCGSVPDYQKTLIKTLQLELQDKRQDLKIVKYKSKAWKYVAIGLGSVAIGATTYSIIK